MEFIKNNVNIFLFVKLDQFNDIKNAINNLNLARQINL